MAIYKPKFLNWLPEDKWLHFLVGFVIGFFAFPLLEIVFESHFGTDKILVLIVLSTLFGVIAGIGKEIADKEKSNLFDTIDVVATGVGSLAASLVMALIYTLL